MFQTSSTSGEKVESLPICFSERERGKERTGDKERTQYLTCLDISSSCACSSCSCAHSQSCCHRCITSERCQYAHVCVCVLCTCVCVFACVFISSKGEISKMGSPHPDLFDLHTHHCTWSLSSVCSCSLAPSLSGTHSPPRLLGAYLKRVKIKTTNDVRV